MTNSKLIQKWKCYAQFSASRMWRPSSGNSHAQELFLFDGIITGIGKIWYRKKSRNRSPKNLVPEKSQNRYWKILVLELIFVAKIHRFWRLFCHPFLTNFYPHVWICRFWTFLNPRDPWHFAALQWESVGNGLQGVLGGVNAVQGAGSAKWIHCGIIIGPYLGPTHRTNYYYCSNY